MRISSLQRSSPQLCVTTLRALETNSRVKSTLPDSRVLSVNIQGPVMSTPAPSPAQGPQQQFCVRWNSYQSNLQNAFPKLLTSEHFVDVTLACESEMIKCHKVVLSACSTYFEKLLVQNPCQHPIIFMKDMRFLEMQALVDFMYKGEVNVTQDELPSLLRSAEALQIRGLCGSDQLLSQHYLGALQNAKQNAVNETKTTVEQKPPSPKQERKPSIETEFTPEIKNDNVTNENSHNGSLGDESPNHNLEPSLTIKEDTHGEWGGDADNDDSYYGDGEGELIMDSEYLEGEEEDLNQPGTSGIKTEYPIANVSCQYSGQGNAAQGNLSTGSGQDNGSGMANRRIRRSEAELRRAAECITRGQTFQTVSDQFNIPISTIR